MRLSKPCTQIAPGIVFVSKSMSHTRKRLTTIMRASTLQSNIVPIRLEDPKSWVCTSTRAVKFRRITNPSLMKFLARDPVFECAYFIKSCTHQSREIQQVVCKDLLEVPVERRKGGSQGSPHQMLSQQSLILSLLDRSSNEPILMLTLH